MGAQPLDLPRSALDAAIGVPPASKHAGKGVGLGMTATGGACGFEYGVMPVTEA